MANVIQVNHIYSLETQRLRNVAIHIPSIFWVQSGHKQLFWQDDELTLNSSNLLVAHHNQQLTFENKPEREKFTSIQFSFYFSPPEEMLDLSSQIEKSAYFPLFTPTPKLLETLKIFSNLSWNEFSLETQKFWLLGFYQQLAEDGKLHRLFSSDQISFSQKLSEYLIQEPSKDYQLDKVAEYFAISRATLIRRLKKEETQFKKVLTQVRMNHALNLMQKGNRQPIDVALRCGYQSQERFSQRFNKQFGISPKQYLKTLEYYT